MFVILLTMQVSAGACVILTVDHASCGSRQGGVGACVILFTMPRAGLGSVVYGVCDPNC